MTKEEKIEALRVAGYNIRNLVGRQVAVTGLRGSFLGVVCLEESLLDIFDELQERLYKIAFKAGQGHANRSLCAQIGAVYKEDL